MQIVIDIPDDEIEYIKNTSFVEHESTVFKQSESDRKKTMMIFNLLDAIRDGTPLPKGHGRLKDIDKIISDGISKGFCDWYDEIEYAPTIIEADEATESEVEND